MRFALISLSFLLAAFAVSFPAPVFAQTAEQEPSPPVEGMDVTHLGRIIETLDPKADTLTENAVWRFAIDDVQVTIIADAEFDRMRALVAITRMENLDSNVFQRLLQANFDTALDARYAIARDVLWSAFIHPLSRLNEEQLLSGIAQTVTLAQTFGSTYSSGGLSFGGGDSGELLEERLRQKLIEEGFSL